jgi:outer membrane protein, protease secretion system
MTRPQSPPRRANALRDAIAVCLGLSLSTICTAQDPQVVNLIQAYNAALAHDASYRAAQAARDAGQEERILGRAQLLPTIAATAFTDRTRSRSNEREVLTSTGTTQNNAITDSSSNLTEWTSTRGGFSSGETSRSTDQTTHDVSGSDFSNQSFSEENTLGSTRARASNGTLQLRQPLINFGALAGYRQGNALTAASSARFRAQQQELMVRVSEAYAQTLFAQENLGLAQSQLRTLEEQQAANERMLTGGEGTLTDVLETRAKREVAQAQLLEAEQAVATARNRLQSHTGLEITTLAPLKTDVASTAGSGDTPEHWRDLAMSNNGLLESLRQQVVAAGEEARKAEAGHYPRLDLVASISRDEVRTTPYTAATLNTNVSRDGTSTSSSNTSADTTSRGTTGAVTSTSSTSGTQSTTHSTSNSTSAAQTQNADLNRRNSTNRRIGLELNIPLFAGGAVSSRSRQAAARLVQTQAEMDAKVDEILLELNRQLRLQQSTAQRAKALERAVASSRVAVDATIKSMAAGVRTNLDVLNARERLTAAERELANARYSHLLAYLKLRFNAGVLTEQDLHEVAGR